jgi:hypothetical protein
MSGTANWRTTAEEVGLAHKEALLVVVIIYEPAGDSLGTVTSDFPGIGVKYIHAIDLYLNLAVLSLLRISMSGSPKMTNRFPLPVFFSSSDMCRSAFMRAFRTGILPNLLNSEE